MKLRRALATAAAAAAIAPAALLAAPAAYADSTPEPTPSATVDPTTEPPAPTPSATTEQPTAPATTPAPSPTTATPTPTPTTPTQTPTTPAPTTPTPTPTATETTPGDDDEDPICEEESEEAAVRTELRGLPSKVVAGSGWVNFTFRTINTSDRAMKEVDEFVGVGAISKDDISDVSKYLTLQWYDQADGVWKTLDKEAGYITTIADLGPDEYADAKLRLKVDARTPGSYGFAMSIGAYHNEDDVCGFSEALDYEFDVLVAGSKPGPVEDSEGKPGKGGKNLPKPQGDLDELPVTGELAQTGSSSMLPTIAMIGGVAVVAGAGAVFVVRRRRTDGAAA